MTPCSSPSHPPLHRMLLRTSLLDWIQDRSMLARLDKYKPLLLGLSDDELQYYLQAVPASFRDRLVRPGLIHQLAPSTQRLLLPAAGLGAAMKQHEATRSSAPPSPPPLGPPGWESALTKQVLAMRVTRSARQLLLTPDPPLTRILTVAAVAAVVFRFTSSGSTRRYAGRLLKHGSTVAMVGAALSLSTLAASQLLAQRTARHRAAGGADEGPASLPAAVFDRVRMFLRQRTGRRVAAYATPAVALALLFFLMQLRLGGRGRARVR